MPTYEYKCNDCEELFEYFQRITDEPLNACPVCGGELVRLISGGMGIIFKGSGFYTTDYKNSSSILSRSKKDDKATSEKKDGDHSKYSKSEVKDDTA